LLYSAEQVDKVDKVTEKWTKLMFLLLLQLSNNGVFDKNVTLCLFCFSHVMQKQTLNEIEMRIWTVIWCSVMWRKFMPKVIKIC